MVIDAISASAEAHLIVEVDQRYCGTLRREAECYGKELELRIAI